MGTTEDGAPQNSNAKIAPFQPVHPESSSDEDITDNEQDITNNDDEEIINDAFAVRLKSKSYHFIPYDSLSS